jgi:hypothetical protein
MQTVKSVVGSQLSDLKEQRVTEQEEAAYIPPVYEGVSKIFHTDAVKIISLTIKHV